MAVTVDALTLKVQTSADSAATSVDKLIRKLGELKTLLGTGFAVEFGKNIQKSVSAAMQNVEKTVVGSMKKAATEAGKAFKPKAAILPEFKSYNAKTFKANMYGPSPTTAQAKAAVRMETEKAVSEYARKILGQMAIPASGKSVRSLINSSTGVARGRTKSAERSAYAMDAEMQKREWNEYVQAMEKYIGEREAVVRAARAEMEEYNRETKEATEEEQRGVEWVKQQAEARKQAADQAERELAAAKELARKNQETLQFSIRDNAAMREKYGTPKIGSIRNAEFMNMDWYQKKARIAEYAKQGYDVSNPINELIGMANDRWLKNNGTKGGFLGTSSLNAATSMMKMMDENAKIAKSHIDGIIGTLNKPIKANWADAIDRMFGIDKKPMTAEEWGIDAFVTEASKQVASIFDVLENPPKINYASMIEQTMGIGAKPLSAEEWGVDAFVTDASKKIQDLIDKLENPPKMNWANVVDQTVGIGTEAKSAKESMSAFIDLAGGLGISARHLRKLNPELRESSELFEKFKKGADSAKSAVKGYVKEHTKLLRQFGRVAKMRAMRAAIRAITSGLKEGIGNLYQYSKAIKGSFAQSMDNASTALLLMKNSIATAVAPLIQALVPVLQTVVGWIREACNWLSQFFAIMNGQSTWTRAVEYATEYAAETKKASDNTRSMLAAFDELNVIQSKSGSGSGNNNNMDYSKMFEEVNHFDSSIEDIAKKAKEVVGWISDNFTTILATAGLIKAAIAAWNISKELAGVMGTLGKWATGGLLITLGVVLSYDFGKKVGLGNELKAGDIIEGIAGVIAAGIGGFLIGGGVGAAVGVSIALVAGLVGYVNGQKEQLRNSRWGTDTMTPEQVKEYVRKMYSFDVENEINLLSTTRLNLEAAKKSVDEKILELEQSLRKVTLGIEDPSSLAQRIKDTADAAVAEYEAYSDLKSAYITVFPKSGLDETLNGSTGREMIEDAGELMGQILVDSAGRKLTEEESEMISRVGKWMHNVLTGADEYQRQLEHATDTRMNLSNFSRDTASEIFEAQKTMDQDFYNEALASQYALADESDRLANYNRSILSEGIDPKTGKQLTKQRIKDLTEEADELEKEAKLIRANAKAYAQGKLASAQNASKDIWADTLQDVYSKEMTEKWRMYGSFQDADRYNIKEYVKSGDNEKAAALFEKGLGTLIKGIDPIAFDVSQYYNLTGWDVLSKDGRAMLVETMKSMFESDATVQMLRDVCKIDVDDIMDVYGYDDLGNAEQRKFEHAMLKAYGAEAVATLQKKTKLDVLGIITTSGYEKLSKQERENFTTAMFKAYGYKDTITELKRYCKYDINDVISVSGYQSMTETERRKFVTNCVAAYGPSAVSEIKKNTKIKATELIDIGSWKEFTLEQKIDFIEAIADAYGSKEAVAAAKSAGVDIASLIGEGMESQDPAIRKKAADLRSSMEEVIAGKPIDVKVEPKTEKSVWQKALEDIKSFFKDPINAVVNWTTNLINGATGGSGSTFLNTLGNTLYNAGKTAAKNLGFNNSANIEPEIETGASAGALNDMLASTNKTVKETLLDLPRTTQYPLFRQQFTVKTLSGKENSKTLKVFNMEKAEVEWLKKNGYKLNEVNYNYGQGKRQITQMYKGGYDIPAGDLFMANERGAELVGQIGNKTAVANQNQIITGISNGVQQAMRGVEARLSRIERNTGITADKDFSVKLTPSVGLGRVNAQSAAMYGGMTGK